MSVPIIFECFPEGMKPLKRFANVYGSEYEPTKLYTLVPVEDRSTATHNHEFAWLAEAWRNLPEDLADQYPSVEHLRKRSLIQAGYYDEQIIDAGSNAAALRVAAAFRSREEFSLVIVRQVFVVIRTAKSQSRRAMDRKTFQESKSKIMDIVSQMIGVEPATLARETGKAA